ncbi:MAG TPA: cytochrome P450 [Ktedonobacteraceae bacterium]|nr:cytochrome P450 [Ktedonobacteraceae bacterium]
MQAAERATYLTQQEGCPVVYAPISHKKTRLQDLAGPAIECDARGIWHIRDFALTRSVLRNGQTRQAGFNADMIARVSRMMRLPILYQDGKLHHEQRRQTARFFAPKTVSTNYREMMEKLVERLVKDLQQAGQADFSDLTLEMAVRVAAQVIGLTNSRLPGMGERLDAFFKADVMAFSWRPHAIWQFLNNQRRMLAFYMLDVDPAIRARRRQPGDDLISHLIEQGYNNAEIMTECVTFAAAGMATTREFLSVAAWHMLEHPALRARYLIAPEEERYAILHEILRLEPVVGHIFRRSSVDLELEHKGQTVVIPQDALIDLNIHSANTDEEIVGEHQLQLCPARAMHGERIPAEMMSFGDGYHRCPGSYLAIQESDMLLKRLLAFDGLSMKHQPNVGWNEIVGGYELRRFMVALD